MNPPKTSNAHGLLGLKGAILLIAASVFLLGVNMAFLRGANRVVYVGSGFAAMGSLLLLLRFRKLQKRTSPDRNLRKAISHAATSGRSEMPEIVIVEGACRFPEVRSAFLFVEVPGSRVEPLLLASAGDPPEPGKDLGKLIDRGRSFPVPSWPGSPPYRLTILEKQELSKERAEQLECYAELAGGYLASGTALREYSLAHNRLNELERQMELARGRILREARQSLLGKLVSNIAHELNNPLAAVLGSAQCLRAAEKDPEILRLLDSLETEAKRCKDIVDQVTELASEEESRTGRIHLHDLIEESLQLLSYKFRRNRIETQKTFAEQSFSVEGDAALMTQAFLNLGNLLADLLALGSEPRVLFARTQHSAEKFSIALGSDSCVGIPKETLERPGLRLSLWVAGAILEEYGGRLDSSNLTAERIEIRLEFAKSASLSKLASPVKSS